jgi:hypothetical protein
MKRFFSSLLKVSLAISLVVGVLSGCADSSAIKNNYPLESVENNGNQTSYVYRAENKTVPQVAKEITDDRKPEQVSKEDTERMFIVYPDELYHLQKDPKKPQDTLIEIDNKEFVKENYDSSFLKGYLTARIVESVFDLLGNSSSHNYPYGHDYGGHYRGYGQKDQYKAQGNYHAPTDADKKNAPPVTVQKKGSIIKRGNSPSSSTGSEEERNQSSSSTSKGKIIRSGSNNGDSSYSGFPSSSNSPPSISPPKTRSGGFGKIKRRSRH